MHHYVLNADKTVHRIDDLIEWANRFEMDNRFVAKSIVDTMKVSTVFLGLDYSFGDGPPILFETMVFGGRLDGRSRRCSTYAQAEQQHIEVLAKVREAQSSSSSARDDSGGAASGDTAEA
jgi:hypothetical protein